MVDPEARVRVAATDATAAAFASANRNLQSFTRGAMQARRVLAGFGVAISGRALFNWMSRSIEATNAIGEQRQAVEEAKKAFDSFRQASDQLGEIAATRLAPAVTMLAGALNDFRSMLEPSKVEVWNEKLKESELRVKSLEDSIARNQAVKRHDGFLGFLFGSDTMDADLARLRAALQQAQSDLAVFQAGAAGQQPPGQLGEIDVTAIRSRRGELSRNTMRAMPSFNPNAPTADQLRAAQRITEQMKTDVEQQTEAWREAKALFDKGLISDETMTRFRDSLLEPIEVSAQRMKEMKVELEDTRSLFDDFAHSIGRGLQSTLADAMLGIRDDWSEMLRRMAAEAAVNFAFNAFAGLGGKAGSFFTTLGFGGARARGGPTQAGKAYLVGEKGPEWWSAGAGYVTPMGGVQINVVNHGKPEDVQTSTRQGAGGMTIVDFIFGATNTGFAKGSFDQAMAHRFGLRPVTGTR